MQKGFKMKNIMTGNYDDVELELSKLRELGYFPLNLDALWKWASLLHMFEQVKPSLSGNKVLEAGGGHSPVSKILSWECEVNNVDVNFNDVWIPFDMGLNVPDNSNKIQCDFIEYCKTLPDNSIDVVVDGCSMIHFDTSSDFINKGLKSSCDEIKRVLKDDGFLLMASDCLFPESSSVKGNSGELLYPNIWVDGVLSSGLSLVGDIDLQIDKNAILPKEMSGPSHIQVAFEYPIPGWTQTNGDQLTVFRGIFSK
jgi:SAM-dependent methyltransferase